MSVSLKKEALSAVFTRIGILLLPALGVVFYRVPAWILHSSSIGANDPSIMFVSRMLQYTTLILLVVLDRYVSYNRTLFLRILIVATVIKTLGVVVFISSPDKTFLYIGCGINSVCSAIQMLGFGYYLCSLEPWGSTYVLTLSFAVHSILIWALSKAVSQVLIAVLTISAILAFLCLRHCLRDPIENTGRDYHLPKKDRSLPWDIILILFVCTVISILARLLVPINMSHYSTYLDIQLMVFLFIFAFYTVWMVVLRRSDFGMLWPLFVIIILSGLLYYTSMSNIYIDFASSFFRATQDCLMLFCWIVAATVIHQSRLPRVFFFGLSVLLFVTPPTLVSYMITNLFPSIRTGDLETSAIIVFMIMAFVLIVMSVTLIIVSSVRNTRRSVSEVYAEQAFSYVSKAIDSIIIDYGLSKREGEVLGYLIKGQTFSQMASAMFISLNTVRTHMKSIYRKIGINERQQLIALVEENVQSLLLINPKQPEKDKKKTAPW